MLSKKLNKNNNIIKKLILQYILVLAIVLVEGFCQLNPLVDHIVFSTQLAIRQRANQCK